MMILVNSSFLLQLPSKKNNILGTPFFEEFVQFINFKILPNNLNTNLQDIQTVQNLHHYYTNITHIFRTSTESILEHKYV